MVVGRARSVVAFDLSQEMLDVNARKLAALSPDGSCWSTQVADHRCLPSADRSADLVLSGWSIGYLGK